MKKRHYMCTHTWESEEARVTSMNDSENLTDRQFFESFRTPKAECIQHWMGENEFFFCHWIAESEDAIFEALEANGMNNVILTLPYETPRYVSVASISDELLKNPWKANVKMKSR
jgi:hypothetical protein